MSFGQRCCAGFVAITAVLWAFLAAAVVRISSKPGDVEIDVLSTERRPPFSSATRTLSGDEIDSYRRDGVVLVRGLLAADEASALVREAEEEVQPRAAFTVLDLFTARYRRILFDVWRHNDAYAHLALRGLPSVAAQLLAWDDAGRQPGEEEEEEGRRSKLRLLRDAYFVYAAGGEGCGWHVDDEGFWPARNDTSGLTVWIALDPMRVAEGGGVAVANSTLVRGRGSEWLERCRSGRTCSMESDRPRCHEDMEEMKLEWDMQPGDAILWDRWTFHRGMPLVESSSEGGMGQGGNAMRRRYSIRYIPSHATPFGLVHHSVNAGSTFDSPYYPQVWPSLVNDEVEALKKGLDGDATLLNVFKVLGLMLRTFVGAMVSPD